MQLTTKEVASIFSISDDRVYQFAKQQNITSIKKNAWGLDIVKAYATFLRQQSCTDENDPKTAKTIADTEKARAETELKRLDFAIKQKEYVRADIVAEVISDITRTLTKKVYDMHNELNKYESFTNKQQDAVLSLCENVIQELKLECIEKAKSIDDDIAKSVDKNI